MTRAINKAGVWVMLTLPLCLVIAAAITPDLRGPLLVSAGVAAVTFLVFRKQLALKGHRDQ